MANPDRSSKLDALAEAFEVAESRIFAMDLGVRASVRLNPDEGPKLTVTKVKKIKVALFKSKTQPTLKALAKMFKVSDMQIHRIKTGENWGHVKV